MAQRRAVTSRLAARYRQATRAEKSEILTHLVELTGWHRDHARAQLRAAGTVRVAVARKPRPPLYSERVITALETCWCVARFPAGKRLAPMLPTLVPMLRRDGGRAYRQQEETEPQRIVRAVITAEEPERDPEEGTEQGRYSQQPPVTLADDEDEPGEEQIEIAEEQRCVRRAGVDQAGDVAADGFVQAPRGARQAHRARTGRSGRRRGG